MSGASWGVLALGLFANGTYGQGLNGVARGVTGLFYGDGGQLVASVVGIVANVAYIGGATGGSASPLLALTVLPLLAARRSST